MSKISLPEGPYKLTNAGIDAHVPEGIIGVYALGYMAPDGNGIIVLRIGRSDTDLNHRLKQYINGPDANRYRLCTHYMFGEVRSERVGFNQECNLYHAYEPELNDIHPARPAGTDYCCPVDDECLVC